VKILLIRFSSIGDIVLTSPVSRILKTQVPGIIVHYLTRKKFKSLLEFDPFIDQIHLFDENLGFIINELKKEKFDLILDLHNNLRSRVISLAINRPTVHFPKENILKWLYVRFKKDYLPHTHIVDRYLKTAEILGVVNDNQGLGFYPCDCESVTETDLPEAFRNKKFIIFSIGGTHSTKRMPAKKWNEILSWIPAPVIIIGGKEDQEAGEQIVGENPGFPGQHIWNACGQFSIGGSSYLIRMSSLVITHDTGMMHIAAAFKKPTVAIWGNTTPRLGMYPYQTEYISLEVNDLPCRPCSKIGFSACPEVHFQCMEKQNTGSSEFQSFVRRFLK
jgi:heptosyltransferase-2